MLLLVFERPAVRLHGGDGLLSVRGIQALCWPLPPRAPWAAEGAPSPTGAADSTAASIQSDAPRRLAGHNTAVGDDDDGVGRLLAEAKVWEATAGWRRWRWRRWRRRRWRRRRRTPDPLDPGLPATPHIRRSARPPPVAADSVRKLFPPRQAARRERGARRRRRYARGAAAQLVLLELDRRARSRRHNRTPRAHRRLCGQRRRAGDPRICAAHEPWGRRGDQPPPGLAARGGSRGTVFGGRRPARRLELHVVCGRGGLRFGDGDGGGRRRGGERRGGGGRCSRRLCRTIRCRRGRGRRRRGRRSRSRRRSCELLATPSGHLAL